MNYDQPIIRSLHPQTKIIDQENGIVDYIASDETIDSYGEIVKVSGWRFDRFRKNAPFVDSHDYWSIDKQLGKVLSWRFEESADGKPQLIQRVKWAIDVEENKLAQLGWKMTVGEYLKAVSVGFQPLKWVSPWKDSEHFAAELAAMGHKPEDNIRTIFLEQDQLELSACIIGANPSAVARAYKGGAIGDQEVEDLETLFRQHPQRSQRQPAQTATSAQEARAAEEATRERQEAFLGDLHRALGK